MVVFVLCPMSRVVVDVAIRICVFSVTSNHMVIVPSLPNIISDLMIAVSFE